MVLTDIDRIAISGYKDIEGKNFDVVHDIGAISGYKEIDVFSSISKIWSILGTICRRSQPAFIMIMIMKLVRVSYLGRLGAPATFQPQ
jgi:hypothetical protein